MNYTTSLTDKQLQQRIESFSILEGFIARMPEVFDYMDSEGWGCPEERKLLERAVKLIAEAKVRDP